MGNVTPHSAHVYIRNSPNSVLQPVIVIQEAQCQKRLFGRSNTGDNLHGIVNPREILRKVEGSYYYY